MFTGIVTHRAELLALSSPDEDGVRRMTVRLDAPLARAEIGDSIAFDGVCLTLVSMHAQGLTLAFDVIPETLARTTLGRRAPGYRFNVEAALRAGDPLGGHTVQGHVEGVGEVVDVARSEAGTRLRIRPPDDLLDHVLEKGSIAVDGVSLTVGAVVRGDTAETGASDPGGYFEVHLIPHTLLVTGMGALAEGDPVNLECDVMARMVARYVEAALARTPKPT